MSWQSFPAWKSNEFAKLSLGAPSNSLTIFKPDNRLAIDYIANMSSTKTTVTIPGLSEEQRKKVLRLKAQIESIEAELNAILEGPNATLTGMDLRSRSIDESQAADLRARLKTFAEDWDRPEAAVYDQSPAR